MQLIKKNSKQMIKTKQQILKKLRENNFRKKIDVEIKISGVISKNVVKSESHWAYGQNPMGLQ